jgi:hypothetical protein
LKQKIRIGRYYVWNCWRRILTEKSAEYQNQIEPRLMAAYTRIRTSVRNLAVVSIERVSAGSLSNSTSNAGWNCLWKKIIIDHHLRILATSVL